jgi:MFS superfamily sulfate permease-like transporter
VEVSYAMHLFRTRLWDFAVFMVSFLAVMFLGIELGLIPAVAMPLITMMMEAAMPPTSILGQVENTTAYRWAAPAGQAGCRTCCAVHACAAVHLCVHPVAWLHVGWHTAPPHCSQQPPACMQPR